MMFLQTWSYLIHSVVEMHSPVGWFYRENPQFPTEKNHKCELCSVQLFDAVAGQLRFDQRDDELVEPRFSRVARHFGTLESQQANVVWAKRLFFSLCLYTQSQCFVLFLLEVSVTNWATQYLQYQPNGRWNMSKMLNKISRLSGRHIVYKMPSCPYLQPKHRQMEVERPSLRSHPELDFSPETRATSWIEIAFKPHEHLRRPEVIVSHGEESNGLCKLNIVKKNTLSFNFPWNLWLIK